MTSWEMAQHSERRQIVAARLGNNIMVRHGEHFPFAMPEKDLSATYGVVASRYARFASQHPRFPSIEQLGEIGEEIAGINDAEKARKAVEKAQKEIEKNAEIVH